MRSKEENQKKNETRDFGLGTDCQFSHVRASIVTNSKDNEKSKNLNHRWYIYNHNHHPKAHLSGVSFERRLAGFL